MINLLVESLKNNSVNKDFFDKFSKTNYSDKVVAVGAILSLKMAILKRVLQNVRLFSKERRKLFDSESSTKKQTLRAIRFVLSELKVFFFKLFHKI